MVNEQKDRKPNPYYEMFTDEIRVSIEEKEEQVREKEWGMKQCTKCGGYKSDSDFYSCSQKRDGLQSWCKSCYSLSNKMSYNSRVKNATSEKRFGKSFFIGCQRFNC